MKLTKIKYLHKNDVIFDSEGIALTVKNIEKKGKRYSVTVSFVENGFYGHQDITQLKNGSTCVYSATDNQAIKQC